MDASNAVSIANLKRRALEHIDMPATPSRVWKSIQSAHASAAASAR
jgi:hypothetical protein